MTDEEIEQLRRDRDHWKVEALYYKKLAEENLEVAETLKVALTAVGDICKEVKVV